MVAEYWQGGRHLNIQRLLVGVPSVSEGGTSHFDRIDDDTAHCAAGVNLKEAHIKDIAPTVLSLLEIPISRELIGQPLRSATLTARQTEYVASYGAPKKPRRDSRPAIDEEELRRLKALGYIQ